jgi:hypothetical protein
LGISRSTFIRRVLPYVDVIEMPWGAQLIPADELERLLAERRRLAKSRPTPLRRGRPRHVQNRWSNESRRTRRGPKSWRDRPRTQRRRRPNRARRPAVVALNRQSRAQPRRA